MRDFGQSLYNYSMIKKYRIMTSKLLNALADIEEAKRARLEALAEYDGILLKEKKAGDRSYYSSCEGKGYGSRAGRKDSGGAGKSSEHNDFGGSSENSEHKRAGDSEGKAGYDFKYAGSSKNEKVLRVKEFRYLQKQLKVIVKDMKLLNCVLKKLEDIDNSHINDLLPALYRASDLRQEMSPNRIAAEWKRSREAYKATFPPYRPEELTVPTYDGTLVRSKSEALIYNFFLDLGLTFVYELPLETKVRTFYPDFTILSEIDYRSVYRIEHQGMMNDDYYLERYKQRVRDYLRAGYVQGINIFFTFDFYDGGVDMEPILDIIRLKIRPDAKFPLAG